MIIQIYRNKQIYLEVENPSKYDYPTQKTINL